MGSRKKKEGELTSETSNKSEILPRAENDDDSPSAKKATSRKKKVKNVDVKANSEEGFKAESADDGKVDDVNVKDNSKGNIWDNSQDNTPG